MWHRALPSLVNSERCVIRSVDWKNGQTGKHCSLFDKRTAMSSNNPG